MGYIMCTAVCPDCGQPFSFHPNKVPSIGGLPFCKACVDRANPIRKERGLPWITYDDDAYASGQEEHEIDWEGKPRPMKMKKEPREEG